MVATIREIDFAINKSHRYIREVQDNDGSWTLSVIEKNEPVEYHHPLIITTLGVANLSLYTNKENLDAIGRGLRFLLENRLSKADPLSWISRKLYSLYFINTDLGNRQAKQLVSYLKNRQSRDGSWKKFANIDVMTSKHIIRSLVLHGELDAARKGVDFLLKVPAKDGKGWGLVAKDKESYPSFTANMIESLAMCRVSPNSPALHKARKFLEATQNSNGGWPQSRYTEGKKSTSYGTALCVIGLMLSSEKPFNSKVEKGVRYLLRTQKKNGSWSVVRGGKSEIYTTYYATKALAMYKYLKGQRYFKEVPAQYISINAFLEFDKIQKDRLYNLFEHRALSSRMLGATSRSIKRRTDILKLFGKHIDLTPADIVDLLKRRPEYAHLKKRAYLTQIQLDLRYLKDLNLIDRGENSFFATHSFF